MRDRREWCSILMKQPLWMRSRSLTVNKTTKRAAAKTIREEKSFCTLAFPDSSRVILEARLKSQAGIGNFQTTLRGGLRLGSSWNWQHLLSPTRSFKWAQKRSDRTSDCRTIERQKRPRSRLDSSSALKYPCSSSLRHSWASLYSSFIRVIPWWTVQVVKYPFYSRVPIPSRRISFRDTNTQNTHAQEFAAAAPVTRRKVIKSQRVNKFRETPIRERQWGTG